jgi:hypothetical protein
MSIAPPLLRTAAFDAAQAGIDGFDRLHSGLDLARVPDHIRVGEVNDDYVERSLFRRLYDGIGNAGGAHLRLQIVRRYFRRLHHHALLAGKRLLHATVEKVCDMRIFLGLGHTQVAHVETAHHVGQDIRHRFRWNHHRQAEILVILRHADIVQIFGERDRGQSWRRDRPRREDRCRLSHSTRCCVPVRA